MGRGAAKATLAIRWVSLCFGKVTFWQANGLMRTHSQTSCPSLGSIESNTQKRPSPITQSAVFPAIRRSITLSNRGPLDTLLRLR